MGGDPNGEVEHDQDQEDCADHHGGDDWPAAVAPGLWPILLLGMRLDVTLGRRSRLDPHWTPPALRHRA